MKLVVLAPMSGFTHSPFRRLARKLGADWTWTELISAKMIFTKGLDHPLLSFTEEERPLRLQLYGADPDDLFRAGELVLKYLRPDGLDLNAGCPAPKVTRLGAGAALLEDLSRLYEAACAITEACKGHGITPSVKFRLGWNEDQMEKIAETLLKAGVKILVLHARLAKESFSSQAQWSRIKDLKDLVGQEAMIIGNGDVQSIEDISKLFQKTDCDGVMIGRAALSRPWIFTEWKEGKILEFSLKDRIRLIRQLWRYFEEYNRTRALKGLKVLVPRLFKGVHGRRYIVPWLFESPDEMTFKERLACLEDEKRPFTADQ